MLSGRYDSLCRFSGNALNYVPLLSVCFHQYVKYNGTNKIEWKCYPKNRAPFPLSLKRKKRKAMFCLNSDMLQLPFVKKKCLLLMFPNSRSWAKIWGTWMANTIFVLYYLVFQLFQNLPIYLSILCKMESITSHILQAKRWSIVEEGDVRYLAARNFEYFSFRRDKYLSRHIFENFMTLPSLIFSTLNHPCVFMVFFFNILGTYYFQVSFNLDIIFK